MTKTEFEKIKRWADKEKYNQTYDACLSDNYSWGISNGIDRVMKQLKKLVEKQN